LQLAAMAAVFGAQPVGDRAPGRLARLAVATALVRHLVVLFISPHTYGEARFAMAVLAIVGLQAFWRFITPWFVRCT
jgi:hypothetical protein